MSLLPQVFSIPVQGQGAESVLVTLQLSRKQGQWLLFCRRAQKTKFLIGGAKMEAFPPPCSFGML